LKILRGNTYIFIEAVLWNDNRGKILMMTQSWNDINDPGAFRKKEPKSAEKAVSRSDAVRPAEKPEDEVRLISAKWVPGPDGFACNEQCFLEVKAQFLKPTIRSKIQGNLFGIYNGIEHDLSQAITGDIDKETQIARMEIPKLWYVNDDHYNAFVNDKTTPSSYLIKGISHSRGANEIDSPALELPVQAGAELRIQLELDPEDERYKGYGFKLTSSDEGSSYSSTLTVDNDAEKGDDALTLIFTGLDPTLTYTLEVLIDTEPTGTQIFTDCSYEELEKYYEN
jgi:hypothetical protein